MRRALALTCIVTLFFLGSGCHSTNDPEVARHYRCDRADGGDAQCPSDWHCGKENFCYSLEVGEDHPCDLGAGDCGGGWLCGLEGRCRAPEPGPFACAPDGGAPDDTFCSGWRCGVDGVCHAREAGAWPCHADHDCEASWRCGLDGHCLDPSVDALRDLAPSPPSGELISPLLVHGPVRQLAVSAFAPPSSTETGSAVALASDTELAVVTVPRSNVPASTFARTPITSPIDSLALGSNRVLVSWQDGGVSSCAPADGGVLACADAPIPQGMIRVSSHNPPLVVVTDGGTVGFWRSGGATYEEFAAPAQVEDMAVVPEDAVGSYVILATPAGFFMTYARQTTGYSAQNSNGVAIGSTPHWFPLSVPGWTGCSAPSTALTPARLESMTGPAYVASSGLRVSANLIAYSDDPSALKLSPFSVNAQDLQLSAFTDCMSDFLGPAVGQGCPPVSLCNTSSWQPLVREASLVATPEGGPASGLLFWCRWQTADGGITQIFQPYSLETCAIQPQVTSELRRADELLASSGPGRLGFASNGGVVWVADQTRTDLVPINLSAPPDAVVDLPDAGGVFAFRNGVRFAFDPDAGFISLSSTEMASVPEANVDGTSDRVVLYNESLGKTSVARIKDTIRTLPVGFAIEGNASVLDAITPPYQAAVLDSVDGGHHVVLATDDYLLTSTWSPDGGPATTLVGRVAPLPRGRIESLAASTPHPEDGLEATGYVVAASRLFRFAARSETQWKSDEVEVPPGRIISTWSDGARGRAGYLDGRVYALPSRLQIAAPPEDKGEDGEVRFGHFASGCGESFALDDEGILYRLVGPGPIGEWHPVPLPEGFTMSFRDSTAEPATAAGMRVVNGALYLFSGNGQVARFALSGCIP